MIKSMTGFGRAAAVLNGFPLTVEIKSVNNRYKDVSLRLPKSLGALEGDVREFLQAQFLRGSITASLSWEENSSLNLREVDLQVAGHYCRLLRQLKRQLNLAGEIDMGLLATFPDVFRTREKTWEKEKISARPARGPEEGRCRPGTDEAPRR